jgi:hypothetical protein
MGSLILSAKEEHMISCSYMWSSFVIYFITKEMPFLTYFISFTKLVSQYLEGEGHSVKIAVPELE